MVEKIQKNKNSKQILNDMIKNYWFAKRVVLLNTKKNQTDYLKIGNDFDLTKFRELNLIRSTSTKVRDTFNLLIKTTKALYEIENKHCDILGNENFDHSNHSGIMMLQMSHVLKNCSLSRHLVNLTSRMLLIPVLERIHYLFTEFIKHGISDAFTAFKKSEKVVLHLQAGLMWIDDLSKELDPDFPDKIRKFKEAQKYVKETRDKLSELNNIASVKYALVASSRDLITTKVFYYVYSKEMNSYFCVLRDHFIKCQDEYTHYTQEFSGLPFYKFNILQPILGPDNGVSSTVIHKFISASNLSSESFKEYSNAIDSQKSDVELIDTTFPDEKFDENLVFDPIIPTNDDLLILEDNSFFVDSFLDIKEQSKSLDTSEDQRYLKCTEPKPSKTAAQISATNINECSDNKISIFNLDIEELLEYCQDPLTLEKISKIKNTKKYQTLNDLATKLDSLSSSKNLDDLIETNDEKC
ncbi:hypothetical protein HZS_3543 [Henneguya salminicola]|nr:hypothetical protein HZS_3543 [Henneguya salminicola]